MHKKQLPFLDPRAATETCVTNEAKQFKYVLVWVLVMIAFYSQKFADNIAILSSANEWMSLGTMSMRTNRLHWIRITHQG